MKLFWKRYPSTSPTDSVDRPTAEEPPILRYSEDNLWDDIIKFEAEFSTLPTRIYCSLEAMRYISWFSCFQQDHSTGEPALLFAFGKIRIFYAPDVDGWKLEPEGVK